MISPFSASNMLYFMSSSWSHARSRELSFARHNVYLRLPKHDLFAISCLSYGNFVKLSPLSLLKKRQRVSKYVYFNNEAVLACLFSLVLKICFWLTTKVNSKMCPTPRQNGSQIFSSGTGADNKLFKMADVVCGFRVFLPSCCRALSGVRQLKTAAYLHKGNLFC